MSFRIVASFVMCAALVPTLSLGGEIISFNPTGYATHTFSINGVVNLPAVGGSVSSLTSNGASISGGFTYISDSTHGALVDIEDSVSANTTAAGNYAQEEVDYYFIANEDLTYHLSVNMTGGYGDIYDNTTGVDVVSLNAGQNSVDGTLGAGDVYTFDTLTAVYSHGLQNGGTADLQVSAAVPEPSTFALLGLGGIGLAIRAYRRRKTGTNA